MDENREAALHAAEALIANAVALLYPICGEQITAGVLAQMAEEQARLLALRPVITVRVVSRSTH